MTYKQTKNAYGIQGKSSVLVWLRRHGTLDWHNPQTAMYPKSQKHLLIKPRKNYTKTPDSKHWLRKHPNLLKDRKVLRSEKVFVSDITYIKSRECTLYLSLVTDAYSRKIMGHHLSDEVSAEHVVKALKAAGKNKKINQELIHHSDRGLQYCSSIYQDELRKSKISPSMTDGNDCYQKCASRTNQ